MYAAYAGHLEYIKHLVESGAYSLNDSDAEYGPDGSRLNVMSWAARSGRLETIEYLLEQGCHVDDQTVIQAASCGNLHIMERLYSIHSGLFTTIVFLQFVRNAAFHVTPVRLTLPLVKAISRLSSTFIKLDYQVALIGLLNLQRNMGMWMS
jgi:hypothetical protein